MIHMDVHTNRPLKNFTTMKLGGPARFMADANSIDDMIEICRNSAKQQLNILILGGGSNLIARDEGFDGIVIRNRIHGFEILDNQPGFTIIKIGGGEPWDEVVRRTVEMNLSGIEALSAVPGTSGAAPVQNIGAYGQEISESLVSLEAYDIAEDKLISLDNSECGFSYRHSIFRGEGAGRYAIVTITLKLTKDSPKPPFYKAVQDYLDQKGVAIYTPQIIRDAVIAIRSDKLPDPTIHPNAGSFFKNAIVEDWRLNDLKKDYPDIPNYDLGDGKFKVPTGWLIEQAGLKGQLLHGFRVHDKNCLVLINESATSYQELADARDEIIRAVIEKFQIQIEQEPLEV